MLRLLIIAIVLILTGCDDSLDRPISFALPDEFSGPFVVIEHPGVEKGTGPFHPLHLPLPQPVRGGGMFEKPPTPVRCANLDLSPFPSPGFVDKQAMPGLIGIVCVE
mgnify:CR=1 FL=1